MSASLRAPAIRILFALGLVWGSTVHAQANPSLPPLSTNGLPGLIITPVAVAMPVGQFALGVNNFPNFEALWTNPGFTLGRQHNGFLGFNLFPWLDVSARVSDEIQREPRWVTAVAGPGGVLVGRYHAIDLAPNVQLLLTPERDVLPAIAVGAYDITGGGFLKARYAVASKSLGEFARISAGYGVHGVLLNGAFGGLELHPTSWSALQGEWDGTRINAGLAVTPPLPEALARYISTPRLRALWANGKGWYAGASLGLPWDGEPVRGPSAASPTSTPPDVQRWTTTPDLLHDLEGLGLENVAVGVTDSTVRIRYEDRVDLRNALDGLARVLRVAAASAEVPHRGAEITILSSERPVLRVTASATWLQALRDGNASALSGAGLGLSYPADDSRRVDAWSSLDDGRSSRGRADLVLRPSLDAHVAWEWGLSDARLGVVPTLQVPLYAGLHATVGYSFPFWQTRGMIVSLGPLPKPSLDAAVLGYIWNSALSPRSELAFQWSGGHFGGDHEGVRQQAALVLADGLLRLDADVAVTRVGSQGKTSGMGVVGARLLIPRVDTRLWVTTGRYLYGDIGMTAGVSRFFGNTQVALSLESTRNGSRGVFTLSLPLVGGHSRNTSLVRPRMPSDWSKGIGLSLSSLSGTHDVAYHVAEQLQDGSDAWDRLFDRDRLNPAAVRAAMSGAQASRWW